jgi:ornithine carbamoyltransferase
MDNLSGEELSHVLAYAADLKEAAHTGQHPAHLAGKTLAMVFEKPSLRTRVTFEVGMWQLGGHAVYLGPQDIQMGTRESVGDVARNLERWVSGIMARTFAHGTQQELAAGAGCPVINGLSDLEHPCQVLADLLTMVEHRGRLAGLPVAWVGDGNNVCHSLLLGCAKLGSDLRVATPPGYVPRAAVVSRATEIARATGARIAVGTDPLAAVRGAEVIYTDVWTSMGQEAEGEERRRLFAPFQVNAALLAAAGDEAAVMHCLPAHRGEEITDDVLDGPRSIVLDQAENRLHAQKALLALLL